jgi:hypothetical protein
VTCQHCQTDIADKALICYRCGRPTTEPRVAPPAPTSLFEPRRRSYLPIVAVVIAVAVVALVLWMVLAPESPPLP